MKFAHNFDEALRREQYPQEWLDSAISYRQLKKCIKRVQDELRSLGLDQRTLELLWQPVDVADDVSLADQNQTTLKPYQPSYSNDISSFRPKLTIAVNPQNGDPIDAWLSPDTRHYLQTLARSQVERRRSMASIEPAPVTPGDKDSTTVEESGIELDNEGGLETVEVPLISDAEFFQTLRRELVDLGHLQETEEDQLKGKVVRLGQRLNELTQTSSKASKAEIHAWREIFRMYMDAQIFFSSSEQDAGSRDSQHVADALQGFSTALVQQQHKLKLNKAAKDALDSFLQINASLLCFMKFREINRLALTKILKKFDKQTALHAHASLLPLTIARTPFMVQDLAKATCSTIAHELLTIIPQLDDYLCPVCFSISFKPIRLRCTHVFCVRCLLVMQRAAQDHCPLCRGAVVMQASSWDLDHRLMAFLAAKFPAEVRAKQRENERAAGVDRYGEGYTRCCVM